jgi:hypothetical protein
MKHKYTVWVEGRYFTHKCGGAKLNIRHSSVAQNTSNVRLVKKKVCTEVVVA